MARLRTIKSEFWTSEQIVNCSRDARLLFIGLWNFSDDAGIHPASYLRLKMEVFPNDNCSENDIQKWIHELIKNELLFEYESEGKIYWQVTGWQHHQKIDKPTYRYPKPDKALLSQSKGNISSAIHQPHLTEDSTNIQGGVVEYSTTPRRELDEQSSRSRVEQSRTEKEYIREVGKPTSPITEEEILQNAKIATPSSNTGDFCVPATLPLPERDQRYFDKQGGLKNDFDYGGSNLHDGEGNPTQETREIFAYWQSVMGKFKAKMDGKRKAKIMSALKLGYSVEDVKHAIEGCFNTPFNMGDNPTKQKYNDISLILRDSEHIERFIAASENLKGTAYYNAVLEGAI